MRVGSLVELVNDNWTYTTSAIYYPIKNKVYTVRDFTRECGIYLEEIVNPICPFLNSEPGWKTYRFRELLSPISNIEEHIQENTLEPQLV